MKFALYSTLEGIQGPLEGLGGTAVDRVLGGLWVAAALHPGIILGSVQLMMTGPGLGSKCIDGRVRQPGQGADRPRGHTGAPPDAAFAGAPMMPTATIAASAAFGTLTLRQVTAPARSIAKEVNRARARVIDRFSEQGPGAQASLVEALVFALGPLHGGALTAKDLSPKTPEVSAVVVDREGPYRFGTPAWSADTRDLVQPCDVICCADARGYIAIAVLHHPEGGKMVDDLGLRAPPLATPVRRGVTREPVGSAVPASFPAAVLGAADATDGAFTHGLTAAGSLEALAERVRGASDIIAPIAGAFGVLSSTSPRLL